MVQSTGGTERYLDRLVRNVMTALDAGGMLVEVEAQRLAPVDTGTMMRSVSHTKPVLVGDRIVVYVGPGPEAPYAKYTEEPQYTSGKKPGPISRAKGATMPWLRPALHNMKPQITDLVRDAARRSK